MSTQKNAEALQIKKERTLPQVLRDAFVYMGHDALLLSKAVGLYSFTLIFTCLLLSYFIADTKPSPENLFYLKQALSNARYSLFFICVVALIAGFCTLTLVVNTLFLLREKHPDEAPEKLFTTLKLEFPSQLKGYILNFIIVYGLYYVIDYCVTNPLSFKLLDDDELFNIVINKLLAYSPQIIIMPLVLYFGFSSLFMSIRDSTGSSDAFKKIYALSKNSIKKIWLCSFALLVLIWLGKWALDYRSGFLIGLLPFNYTLLTVLFTLKKLISFALLAFVQVGIILLFGSVEAESEKPVIEEEQKKDGE